MAANRTQVYFTSEQRRELDRLAADRGTTLADVVRTAVDSYLADVRLDADEVLDETFGAVPDARIPPRHEWDRDLDPRR